MITRTDMDYHLDKMRASTDEASRYLWAETLYIPFAIPEQRLFGSIYTLARPGIGVTLSEIKIFRGMGRTRFDAAYSDNRQQLPAPKEFSRFTLVNGVSIDLNAGPERYLARYEGFDDTRVEVQFDALMPAYDIHDPTMDPKARNSADEQAAHSGFGASYGGHYDQTGRVTGTLKLRGEVFDIDYVDCMDRSWGPRPEAGCPDMCWMHAIFGEDYAVHAIWQLNPTASADKQYSFAHGYVLENGAVYGLTDASMVVDRHGMWGSAYVMQVTDIRGKQHCFHGAPMASGLWECFPCVGVPNLLNRWVAADGRIGYGELQDALFYDNYLRAQASTRK
jgi:hypothetical protein